MLITNYDLVVRESCICVAERSLQVIRFKLFVWKILPAYGNRALFALAPWIGSIRSWERHYPPPHGSMIDKTVQEAVWAERP